MSRVNLLESLTMPKKSAFDFDFDKLWAPPILSLFTPDDINELRSIATSLRYNGNISKKYEMIDAVMRRRGFRKAHSGTNRVVYNFLESTSFVAKVAIDKVGMTDSPAEYINQAYFKPFCCKIFEVDPSGVIAFVERVNPISSIEEFVSVADDVFNLMVTKIIGKYVFDDLGTRTYMNFGIRQNSNGYTFGPVIIDFPYVYEIDGAKLYCQHKVLDKATGVSTICNGEIDYKPGFNGLYCTKCGREYKAMDLAKDTPDVKFDFNSCDDSVIKKIKYQIRARIIDNGKVIMDSGRSSKHYVTRKEFEMSNMNDLPEVIEVEETIKTKFKSSKESRDIYYSALQRQYYSNMYAKRMQEEYEDDRETMEVESTSSSSSVKVDNETNRVYYNDDDNFDSYPYQVIDVEETIDYLEKETFPEIDNKETPEVINIVNNSVIENSTTEPDNNEINEETNDITVVTNNNPVYYEEPKIEGSVYTEEQIQDMIDEVTSRNQEETGPKESTVLDEEGDKALENPFIRPYTNMPKDDEPIKEEPKEEPVDDTTSDDTNDSTVDSTEEINENLLRVSMDYYVIDPEDHSTIDAYINIENLTDQPILFMCDDYVKLLSKYKYEAKGNIINEIHTLYGDPQIDEVDISPKSIVKDLMVSFRNVPKWDICHIITGEEVTNIVVDDVSDDSTSKDDESEDEMYIVTKNVSYTSEGIKVNIEIFNDTEDDMTFNSSDYVKMVVDGTEYYGICEEDNKVINSSSVVDSEVLFDKNIFNDANSVEIISDDNQVIKENGEFVALTTEEDTNNEEEDLDDDEDEYSEYEDRYYDYKYPDDNSFKHKKSSTEEDY